MTRRTLIFGLGGMAAMAAAGAGSAGAAQQKDLFAPDNLMAWCVVPFDARKRGPEERARMLQKLGFKSLAYDWRDEHLPTLDAEIDALKRHGVRLDAFWFPTGLEPEKVPHVTQILDVLRRREVKTQLWVSLGIPEEGTTQQQRIEMAARPLRWTALEAAKIGGSVGLYNHGGWFGEPENQVAIVEHLNLPNVGIVYNFHHGHEHIDRWPELFQLMKPHLMVLNINGMRKEGPKILPVGEGDREAAMLRVVQRSGYSGPIGILDHREELDAEEALRLNLEGLRKLRL
jgi:sugar phosphate isomerase/epimerase